MGLRRPRPGVHPLHLSAHAHIAAAATGLLLLQNLSMEPVKRCIQCNAARQLPNAAPPSAPQFNLGLSSAFHCRIRLPRASVSLSAAAHCALASAAPLVSPSAASNPPHAISSFPWGRDSQPLLPRHQSCTRFEPLLRTHTATRLIPTHAHGPVASALALALTDPSAQIAHFVSGQFVSKNLRMTALFGR
ncbi:hypothetical protein CERSUDRAFT_90302 [Gelatoporia subvermispora B]|uniref:Uncharacterized protein n=1 Tax=Ceriporiopsis subvermispora (strain B) TaxID=914234 RepID=M2QX70_CERS8|nr:hypothetical protein CERSUDRAFT_90302 [Gelatoporia subvermispora B]